MSLIVHAIKRLRTDGVLTTCRYGQYRLANAYLVWRHGIASALKQTNTDVTAEALGHPSRNYGRHGATSARRFRAFRTTMDRFVRPGPDDVFLDYGSGLGSGLLMAATYPFRAIIGVEISPDLNAQAVQIFRAVRVELLCRDIQFVTHDATTYELPDSVSVVYLYNPFWGSAIDSVLENVRQSVHRAPREFKVVSCAYQGFYNIQEKLASCQWLKALGRVEYPENYPGDPFVVYRAVPRAGAPDAPNE